MVKGFIRSALKWCWSALLRAVSPAVREVAIDPVSNSEAALGSCCRFRLSSVVTEPPAESTDEIRQFLDHRHTAFARGELFHPLEPIGRSGAVLVAHITERGFINADHFLAVYPSPVCENRKHRSGVSA